MQSLIAEGRALTSALAVVEVGASPTEARRYCETYLQSLEVSSTEGLLIEGALRKICGLHRPEYPPMDLGFDGTLERRFHEGAARWLQWAFGAWIPFDIAESTVERRSELDRMALDQWLRAIDLLQTGNTDEGRRYFRRATTLSGLYGTMSNPPIQWTYAASFFPR